MKNTTLIDIEIGQRIRAHRKAANLSRPELGQLLQVTHQQLHKYELGLNRTSVSRLLEIAAALKINYTKLIPGEQLITDIPQKTFDLAARIDNLKPAHQSTLLDIIRIFNEK